MWMDLNSSCQGDGWRGLPLHPTHLSLRNFCHKFGSAPGQLIRLQMSNVSAFQPREERRKFSSWALSSPSQEEAARVFPRDTARCWQER